MELVFYNPSVNEMFSISRNQFLKFNLIALVTIIKPINLYWIFTFLLLCIMDLK